jgi:arsenate reductase
MKRSILFICIHNSARSQMAEAFMRARCGDRFDAYSAGLEPGTLNPLVVTVMHERHIDLSAHTAKSIAAVLGLKKQFDYVVTVCDESSAERCPLFPGSTQRLHWGFPDPSGFQGSLESRLARTREIRDQIESHINDWCKTTCALTSSTAR